jgi:hypothetical protein
MLFQRIKTEILDFRSDEHEKEMKIVICDWNE